MIKNLISSAFISTLIAFISAFLMFVINIFLINTLDTETFGKYSMIRNSIIFFPLLVNLGIGNSIVMMHKNINVFEYNWHSVLNRTFIISFFISFLSYILFYYFFNFSILESFLIFLINLFLSRIILSTSILRLSSQYVLAQTARHIWRLFFLFSIIFIFILQFDNLSLVFILFLIFTSVFLAYLLSINKELKIKRGTKELNYTLVLNQGFMFFVLGLSEAFLSQFDKFLIGYDLGFHELGNYSIISIVPLTVFNITASSIGLIIMPYLINNKNNNFKINYILFFIFIAPIFIFLFFYFKGMYITSLFFNINLQESNNLFHYCNILGLMQYMQLISYFSIGALIDKKNIKNIMVLNFFIIAIFFPIIFNYMNVSNIFDYVFCFIIIWILRFLVSLYYLLNFYFRKSTV